jgi:hypothetical protein
LARAEGRNPHLIDLEELAPAAAGVPVSSASRPNRPA